MIRQIFKYLNHLFTARHTGGFGVHSPYVFNYIQYILKEKHPFYIFENIEKLRSELKKNHQSISVRDFGTGSSKPRKISDIAHRSLKQRKFGQLLFRTVQYFNAKHIVELGTSLGITTAYLSSASSDSQCTTFEGCPETANIAKTGFSQLNINNITTIVGNIDDTLQPAINEMPTIDFAFFDANHQSEPLLRYFELCLAKRNSKTIFVIDDIYWSRDMEYAWCTIKKHPEVMSTIDLFHLGVIFFNKDLYKKHYKIRF